MPDPAPSPARSPGSPCGDDVLWGNLRHNDPSRARDHVSGGRGKDTINDVVQAYTRKPSTISCGPGRDTVELDKHDRLDGTCEVVRRH